MYHGVNAPVGVGSLHTSVSLLDGGGGVGAGGWYGAGVGGDGAGVGGGGVGTSQGLPGGEGTSQGLPCPAARPMEATSAVSRQTCIANSTLEHDPSAQN